MRWVWLLVLAASMGTAQTGPPAAEPALIRGVLLERDTPVASGEFAVRGADSRVFRYRYDAKTYVERDSQMIDVPRLAPGEKIEVVSDAIPGSMLRYARTVHVFQEAPPAQQRALTASRLRALRGNTERVPTGTLTYSGVVFRLTGERLVLHTREGGDQSIRLRQDTRFLENGEIVEAASLQPNTRVFVRAGKDLYDQIEAYQVIWGRILDPK